MEVGAYDLESEGPLPTLPSRKLEGPVVRAHTERASFSSEKPHNFWTVFELTTPNSAFECRKSLDIVFAIDISSSMQQKQKLTSVLAAISDVVSQLTEKDRVSLIPYNDEAHVLFGLHHMTNANKNELQLLLQSIAARGNTNISDALFTALDVIEPKSDADRSRISALFLLTDGYSNRGLNHAEIIDTLSKRHTIENLTVFTFGYGNEHSAELLKDIAFSTGGGCYYYLNSPAEVMHCFSNCLSILKSTLYTNVRIRLEAFEGCRILKLHTKNPCCSFKPMKDFEVRCGSVSAFEFRDLICRISIRNAAENKPHDLIRIILTYVNTFDGTLSISQEIVSVQRRPDSCLSPPPSPSSSSSLSFLGTNIYVEQQLNRQRAIDAIESSIEFVRGDNLNSAQITIYSVVHQIEQSISYIKADPFTLYLLKTLLFCATSLLDLDCSSIYQAHNFISAHQQQRYLGLLPVFGDAQTDVFLQSLQQIRQRYNPSYSISISLPPPSSSSSSSGSSGSSGSGPSSSFAGSTADLYLPDKSSQLSVDC